MLHLKYFFIILIWACSVFAFSQDCDLSISGKVIDDHDDRPLENAVVVVGQTKAISDETGFFIIENLCAGEFDIVISHIECESLFLQIELSESISRTFYLEHHEEQLESIIVEGIQRKGELSKSVDVISEEEIKQKQGKTFGHLLENVEGVSLLKTGSSITKPVIHGLHSQRILTINNGIRLEGQQWGLEHAPPIDSYGVQRISVIKGAGSVEYGSDGIGGVLLVEPAALEDSYGTKLNTSLSMFSNGRGGNVNANYSGKKEIFSLPLSFEVQGSLKKLGDLKAPDYYLNNTAFREQNFSVRGGYVGDQFGMEGQFSQYNSQLGILTDSHIGNVDDLEEAIERGDPLYDFGFDYEINRPKQNILHEVALVKAYWNLPVGQLTAEFGRQYNRREEFDLSDVVPGLRLKTETFILKSALEYDVSEQLSGKSGIQAIDQDYRFDGFYLIPEYQQIGAGLYSFYDYQVNNELIAEIGLRYDWKQYDYQIPFHEFTLIDEEAIDYESVNGSIGEVRNTFNNLFTGSAGLTYDISKNTSLSAYYGLSARQPLPNELYSDGIHHGTAFWEVGAPDLKEEWGNNVQMNAITDLNTFSAHLNAYYNYINNFVYAYPDANSGTISTIRGAFPTLQTNQSNVEMFGIDYQLSNQFLANQLTLTTAGSFLNAQDLSIDEPLVFMPANRLNHSLKYQIREGLFAGLQIQNVFEQKRIPDENKMLDYAPPPAAYSLIDFRVDYELNFLKNPLSVSASVENLLNSEYRDYLDRFRYYVDSPGTNVGLRLNYLIK